MAGQLTLRVDFLRDGYWARENRRAEWPPAPARLFAALVSSYHDAPTAEEREALSALERCPPPAMFVPNSTRIASPGVYVVSADIGNSKTVKCNTTLEKRGKAARRWPGRYVDGPAYFQWDSDRLSGHESSIIDMAHRVPYLGCSRSPVMITPANEIDPNLIPGSDGTRCDAVRVAYPGYLASLERCHAAGTRSGVKQAVPREVRRRYHAPGEQAPVQGIFGDVLTWRLEGCGVGASRALSLARAIRQALMSVCPDPVPELISGHHADGSPAGDHAAVLPLPFVGHEHSDGHVLGFGLALPQNVGWSQRSAILRAASDLTEVTFGMRRYEVSKDQPWSVKPSRWQRASRRWVSATPIHLPRWPKKGNWSSALKLACQQAGLPEVTSVSSGPRPLVEGAVDCRDSDRLNYQGKPTRSKELCRAATHARIEFDRPVVGPVVIGAGQFLGGGLMMPEVAR